MIVCYGKQCCTMFIDALEQHVEDEHLVVRIQVAGCFVRKDQLWLWQECPAYCSTLLLAL